MLILKTEKPINGIYPLISAPEGKTRSSKQRPAVWMFLIQNYLLNKERSLTSQQLTDLLIESLIDSDELSKAFRNNPYVSFFMYSPILLYSG